MLRRVLYYLGVVEAVHDHAAAAAAAAHLWFIMTVKKDTYTPHLGPVVGEIVRRINPTHFRGKHRGVAALSIAFLPLRGLDQPAQNITKTYLSHTC